MTEPHDPHSSGSHAGQARPRWSARKKLYWTSLIGAGLLGVVIGVVNPRPYLDAGALTQSSAIALSAAWIVGLLLVMVLYHRAVDDHEERAMLWANSASWYFLFLAAPVWWLLHRGGLVPPIDLVALFFASIIVNAAVWAWLKFR
ncbi:hypothetical protein [Sphingopyxis sp. MWB1]|uniref:hypothetical protein n=1 Tax=Sphingopyxis sp. MWB1 TaxID=1537715 RepID=UPI00068E3577|nr:hypothetical protein [Sphingopyxis sp. MWB1]